MAALAALPALLLAALLLALLTQAAPAAAQSLVVLKAGDREVSIGRQVDLLEDEKGRHTIVQVEQTLQDRFKQSVWAVPNFGYTQSVYWVRLQVRNDGGAPKDWYLEVGYPLLDRVSLYEKIGDGWEVKESGDHHPFGHREVYHRNFVFRVSVPPGPPKAYFLRIESEGTVQFPLRLVEPTAFDRGVADSQIAIGLFFGIFVVMILYNLFLFLSVRDISYLFYILYISSFGLALVAVNGLGAMYLWPDQLWWTNQSVPVLVSTTLLSILVFSASFLRTRDHSPQLHRVLQGLMVLSSAVVGFAFMGTYAAAIRVGVFLTLPVAFTVFYAGVVSIRRGYGPARYFMLAWSILLVGIVLGALSKAGLLPSNAVTEYSLQIGSAIELILLSLGLADRINVLKRETFGARESELATREREARRLETLVSATREMNAATDLPSAVRAGVAALLWEVRFHTEAELTGFIHQGDGWRGYAFNLAFEPEGHWGLHPDTPLIENRSEDPDTLARLAALDASEADSPWVDGDYLWIPVRGRSRLRALLLLRGVAARPINAQDHQFIETLSRSLAGALANIAFTVQAASRARIEEELRNAAAVHDALVPKSNPAAANLEVCGHFRSAGDSGGDWHGYLTRIPDHLYILVGEAAGQGAASGVVLAAAFAACRTLEIDHAESGEWLPPAEILRLLNQVVAEVGGGRIPLALCVASINLLNGKLTFATAGPLAPMHFNAEGRLRRLLDRGPSLGQDPDHRFADKETRLEFGDLLVFHTDGVAHNLNPSGATVDEKLWVDGFRKYRELASRDLMDFVVKDLDKFYEGHPPVDDQTIVAVRVTSRFPRAEIAKK